MKTTAKNYIRAALRGSLLLVAALALAITPQLAHADTLNNSTNTLKISPVRRDVEIKPGESKTVQTTVTNLTNTPITVRAITNDFIAGDERGTPALILDETKFAETHSLKRFMAPIPNITIPARAAKTVDVVITVPKDAQAGGYFGAVRFAPAAPEGGGQVNLSTSAASLILMTVPGDVVEKLALTDFEIQQGGKSGELFGSSDNLHLMTRFQNQGGVQEGPFGKISVMKDDKVIYEADFNDKNPRDVVLPDGARRWEIPLKNIGNFGQYKVTATFTYGTKNQSIEATKSFWVIPQMMIMWAVVGLIVLSALIVGIWLFLRGYKRRILKQHGGRSGLHVRR